MNLRNSKQYWDIQLVIGEKYYRLTITGFVSDYVSPKGRKLKRVDCLCDCGKTFTPLLCSLKSGHTRSCGCYKKERDKESKNVKHGASATSEYKIWKSMKQRCADSYDLNYGGRGITVCDRWLNSFENFLEDMGERPSEKYSIERINTNGDYEPSNCKWLLMEFQSRNRRMRVDNTSGKTGVFYHSKSDSWDVIWMEKELRKTKCFNVGKFGDNAKFLAFKYRDEVVLKLNNEGYGYSEEHGK